MPKNKSMKKGRKKISKGYKLQPISRSLNEIYQTLNWGDSTTFNMTSTNLTASTTW